MPQSPTPNMLLVQPSENGDTGVWDTLLTTLFLLIDGHDHSSGKGVKVKPNGLTIDADLSMASAGSYYALKDCKAIDLEPRPASEMTAYAGLFFNSSDSNNLYCRTASGTNVRITNGTTLDLTVVGGIGGDYAAVPAELNFVDSSKSYTFRSTSAGNWSRLQAGALRISEFGTTETTYVEIACPAALAGTYTITMPTAAPGATAPVQMSSAGTLTASVADAIACGTVTTSGSYKHSSDETLVLAASLAHPTGAPTFGNKSWTATGPGTVFWPVSIPAGRRIKTITYWYNRSSGTMIFNFNRTTLSTNADSNLSSVNVAAGTGVTSVSTATLNHTVLATDQYWIGADLAAAGNVVFSAVVVYDYP